MGYSLSSSPQVTTLWDSMYLILCKLLHYGVTFSNSLQRNYGALRLYFSVGYYIMGYSLSSSPQVTTLWDTTCLILCKLLHYGVTISSSLQVSYGIMGFSTPNSVQATICEVLSFQFTVSYYILGYFLFNSLFATPLCTTFFPILCRLLGRGVLPFQSCLFVSQLQNFSVTETYLQRNVKNTT